MKYDDSGIALPELTNHLRRVHDLPVTTLRFTPQGEEAYSYVATGEVGDRFFVRVQRDGAAGSAETVSAAIAALRRDCGLDAVLAPLGRPDGRLTSRFRGFRVAVFPFVPGATAFETPVSPSQWMQMAEIVAALHRCGECCTVSIAARETFGNPFAPAIQAALRRAASPDAPATACQRRLLALLCEEGEDVTRTLHHLRDLGAAARRVWPELVPTHGDPNLANFIIGDDGAIHLTDWGELAWGPRERDLFHFTGERFEPFLRRYLERSGRVQLHLDLFAFYAYRWVAQEIADYATRILDDAASPDMAAHAWEELQPFLPTRHQEISASMNATAEVLRRCAGEMLG